MDPLKIKILPSFQYSTIYQACYDVHFKELNAVFNDAGLAASLYTDDREKRIITLHSVDIILPAFQFVAQNIIGPVALSVLASWIYDMWVKEEKTPPSVRVEYLTIDQNRNIVQRRRIEGSAPEVARLCAQEADDLRVLWRGDELSAKTNDPKIQNNDGSKNNWKLSEAQARMSSAITHMAKADHFLSLDKPREAEDALRKSLVIIREAILFQPDNPEYRSFILKVGRKVHDLFGCIIPFENGQYQAVCPVLLSNISYGFSMGWKKKAICSICGQDIFDCEHVPGRIYDNVEARKFEEICNVCGEKACSHTEGDHFDKVKAIRIVTELKINDISLVERPDNPLCAIMKTPISRDEILDDLSPKEKERFEYGITPIFCHRCELDKGDK